VGQKKTMALTLFYYFMFVGSGLVFGIFIFKVFYYFFCLIMDLVKEISK